VNLLDILLGVAVLSYAYSGYRQGFVVGVLSFAGFLGGGFLGMLLAPDLVAEIDGTARQAVAAVALVVVAATVLQVVASVVGGLARDRITWRPARALDALAGAGVGAVAVLVVAWFVASAVRQAPSPTITEAVRQSSVLTTVDRAMPEGARGLFGSFRRLLDQNGVPPVFSGLAPERIRPVERPDPGVRSTPAVAAARDSIVKVAGTAGECNRQVEGTGFVYAPEHVVTNAHVVAGVSEPQVQVGGTGRSLRARVVAYDPKRDLAVLYVPRLEAGALRFDRSATRGSGAVVAGFPRGGPYSVVAARVREQIQARGRDIYGRSQVTRDVFSLYSTVQPGNSGGPLLSPAGRVYGVVFAKSVDDPNTGYALTVEEVQPVTDAAATATDPVSTGGCAD
jgi:S1-C subfamily serine protease